MFFPNFTGVDFCMTGYQINNVIIRTSQRNKISLQNVNYWRYQPTSIEANIVKMRYRFFMCSFWRFSYLCCDYRTEVILQTSISGIFTN